MIRFGPTGPSTQASTRLSADRPLPLGRKGHARFPGVLAPMSNYVTRRKNRHVTVASV